MKRLCPAAMCLLIVSLCFGDTAGDDSAFAISQGFAAARANDWPLAIEYFQKAHAAAPTATAPLYQLGVACQSAGRPLPALAWFLAYRWAPQSQTEEARYVEKQLGVLEAQVRARIDALFSAAMKVAEATEPRPGSSEDPLSWLPIQEARAGMLESARAAEHRARQLQRPGGPVALPMPGGESGVAGTYLMTLVELGGCSPLRTEKADLIALLPDLRQSHNGASRTRWDEWLALAEMNHFLAPPTLAARVALAQELSKDDPMTDLDARAIAVQRGPGEKVPDELAKLAVPIGHALLCLQIVRESHDDDHLSEETEAYIRSVYADYCTWAMCTRGELAADHADLILTSACRFLPLEKLLLHADNYYWPPLAHAWHRATRMGIDPDAIADRLTKAGFSVERRDSAGRSEIHWACLSLNVEAVRLLLTHGTDVNLTSRNPLPPSRGLAGPGSSVAIGIDDPLYGATPLCFLAAARDPEDQRDFTADRLAVADALLAAGADLNARSDGGDTALHFAARAGQKEIVQWLLQHGATAEIKNKSGHTPLDDAAAAPYSEIVALLKGASGSH